jgi:hypothetical protein
MKRTIACLFTIAAMPTLLPASANADPPTGCPAAGGLSHAVEHTAGTPAAPIMFDLVRQVCNR